MVCTIGQSIILQTSPCQKDSCKLLYCTLYLRWLHVEHLCDATLDGKQEWNNVAHKGKHWQINMYMTSKAQEHVKHSSLTKRNMCTCTQSIKVPMIMLAVHTCSITSTCGTGMHYPFQSHKGFFVIKIITEFVVCVQSIEWKCYGQNTLRK